MNKIDFIYFKLSQKYGFNNIAMQKVIKQHYDTIEKDGVFEITGDCKYSLDGVKFIKLDTKETIDIEKEKMEGTFNG